MNYLLICVLTAFLTITLAYESRGETLKAPFYFKYMQRRNDLNVKVILKNKPADVDFTINTCCSAFFKQKIVKEKDYFIIIQSKLSYPEIIVSINLFRNYKISYMNIRILEGRAVDQSYDKYNGVCLNYYQPCTIELDLGGIYPETHVSTAQSTPKIPNTLATTPRTDNNSSYVSGAETNTSYIVAIASVVAGIALFLLPILAVVAIKKLWCIKAPTTPIEQKKKVTNPFYVNLLFLKECAKEIEALENHVYEEINPQ